MVSALCQRLTEDRRPHKPGVQMSSIFADPLFQDVSLLFDLLTQSELDRKGGTGLCRADA